MSNWHDVEDRDVAVHYVEHGSGRPVLILHGAGSDHHEPEAAFEPIFEGLEGFRRIYPDLPGMGLSPAPMSLAGAGDLVGVLLAFAADVTDGAPYLLLGHSAGAHFARGIAAKTPDTVVGLALVCPLVPGAVDVPEHRLVVGSSDLGDDGFRSYFVVQTPEMLERYERHCAPALGLVDSAALGRIASDWEVGLGEGTPFAGPTLVVAGRVDSFVGYAGAVDLLEHYPHASLAVVDDAGHALPHEQPEVLRALVLGWLARTD